MAGNFEHLTIEREPLKNDRRTRKINLPHPDRGDIRAHSRRLIGRLNHSVQNARQQIASRPGSYVLKLCYSGHFDTAHLSKHGIEFISQEDKQLCVVFTDERGLAVFSEHLNRLGLDGAELSYKQILEAIEGIDNWTAEDRKSWAVTHKGLPVSDQFILDIELWPVHVAHHPTRLQVCNAFEGWLKEQQIRRVDKVNLDSLVIYRVEVNAAQAKLLLNHADVRTVDLVPTSGIGYQQLNCDIKNLPGQIPHPSGQAARVCILDSGINTNHPLLVLEVYIQNELDAVRMGANTFDAAAVELILRSVQGNLRRCRNLCYGSLVEACRENKKIVSLSHVNNVLVQPHWRSHEDLIKQQAD